MLPVHKSADERKREEEERQKRITEALAVLEKHPDYPSVFVLVHDQQAELKRKMPEAAKNRLTPERLEHVIALFDIRGAAYVRLVSDLESQKAFADLIDDWFHTCWFMFSETEIDSLIGIVPFEAERHGVQIQVDRVWERAKHWTAEGYRRLAPSKMGNKPARRGYRNEIRKWMADNEITSVDRAARRLNVSESILKSIMSSVGRPRYSAETLEDVLKKIGFRSGDQS